MHASLILHIEHFFVVIMRCDEMHLNYAETISFREETGSQTFWTGGQMEGRQPPGRPRKEWRKVTEEDSAR